MTFGQFFKKQRLKNKVTQRELASYLEVTPQYINNVENGRSVMSPDKVRLASEYMEIPLSVFINKLVSEYRQSLTRKMQAH